MSKITLLGYGDCEFNGEFSLLECLDDAGFDIPYSCRGGNCGACEVQLLSGEVEHIQDPSYDSMEGGILTCCVIPTSDVEIELI